MIQKIIRTLNLSQKTNNKLLRNNIFLFSSNQLTSSKIKISKLANRSLLILQGPETYKLLQGLTTNDINLLTAKSPKSKIIDPQTKQQYNRVSLYTLFLSPKGKVITDAYIYKPKIFLNGKKTFQQDQLWIDVDSSTKDNLFNHLKKYLWKKKVELIDIDKQQEEIKPSVYVGFNHISTVSTQGNQGFQAQLIKQQHRQQEYSNLIMYDPRGSNFGRRILCMQEQFGIPKNQFELVKQENYEQYQKVIGFTPSNLTQNKLPFQFNYDLFNAISFNKGCYLGQQIVSRSYFTGIVRKRVFPFKQHKQSTSFSNIQQGTKLTDQQGKQIGKVIWYNKNKTQDGFGLALVSYLNYFKPMQTKQNVEPENLDEQNTNKIMGNFQIQIQTPFKGFVYCPYPYQLSKYLNDTAKKQQSLEELDI